MMEHTTIFRMPKTMAKALSVEALMRDIPVAELLRRLIGEFLEREGRYTVVEREAADDNGS